MRDPERVVMLWEKNPALGGSIGDRVPATYTNFLEWSRQATQFEAIGGFEDANFNLTGGPEPERIDRRVFCRPGAPSSHRFTRIEK